MASEQTVPVDGRASGPGARPAAGIDVGSRTVKLLVLTDGRPIHRRVAANTHDPLAVCRHLLEGLDLDPGAVVATGYGRHLFRRAFGGEVVSEIRAVGLGGNHLRPGATAILDVGGQDTKAVALQAGGLPGRFQMNDRCAAGTGRFLEVMAAALGYSLAEFVTDAMAAPRAHEIASMCTVFAESEVISLIAQGAARAEVALGIHRAIAERAVAMLRRLGPDPGDVLFCGGGALNPCLGREVGELLGRPVVVPEDPQVVVALGAALHAAARRPAAAGIGSEPGLPAGRRPDPEGETGRP